MQALADRRIGLRALVVQLDTSTASGRLLLNMLLMLTEWEQELLRERTREGVARAPEQRDAFLGRVAKG